MWGVSYVVLSLTSWGVVDFFSPVDCDLPLSVMDSQTLTEGFFWIPILCLNSFFFFKEKKSKMERRNKAGSPEKAGEKQNFEYKWIFEQMMGNTDISIC